MEPIYGGVGEENFNYATGVHGLHTQFPQYRGYYTGPRKIELEQANQKSHRAVLEKRCEKPKKNQ